MWTLTGSAVARSVLSIAIAALVMLGPCGAVDAAAQGVREQALAAHDPAHKSSIRIPAGGPYPVTRKVTIGVDKSTLVEVPVDLKNVLVSNPEVLDAVVQTSRQVYLLAKETGEANAFFFGPDGQKVLFLEVTVTKDLTALNDSLARLLPGSKIRAEMMGDNVVLAGTVVNPIDANRAADLAGRFVKKPDGVVNMLTTGAKEQVLLKVQVAEMARDGLRRIGVDLPEAVVKGGSFTFAKVIQNGFPVTGPIVSSAFAGAAGQAPGVVAGSAFQPSWSSNGDRVTALVQALERAGVLKTLAEPTLTAISGEEAKFHAGGKFPIPIPLGQGQFVIEYQEVGVIVSFKPNVMSEGNISLSISAEVSELTNEGAVSLNGTSIPGKKTRTASTTLELPSGGTLAMAGLLSDDIRQSVEGVPGLKDLPVLGALFRSNDYRRRETELVILVTPYLATHGPAKAFAKPTDGFMPESELKELFFGHINRVYGTGDVRPAGRYHGDYGFIIDYPGVKG